MCIRYNQCSPISALKSSTENALFMAETPRNTFLLCKSHRWCLARTSALDIFFLHHPVDTSSANCSYYLHTTSLFCTRVIHASSLTMTHDATTSIGSLAAAGQSSGSNAGSTNFTVKTGLAQMMKGGVIMDVVNAEQVGTLPEPCCRCAFSRAVSATY